MSSSRVIRNQRSIGKVVVPIEGVSPFAEQAKASSSNRLLESSESRGAEAHQQANEILEHARAVAKDIERRAYDEGYLDGKQQGLRDTEEACRSRIDEAVQRAAELMRTAQAERSAVIGSIGDVLTDLVVTAVDSILHRPETAAYADVARVVEELLAEEVRSAEVEVRVHPDDYSDVVSLRKMRSDGTTQHVMVVPDNTITRGGCIVVTGTEEIDASLETGLELLVPAVKRAVGRVLDERTVGVFSGV